MTTSLETLSKAQKVWDEAQEIYNATFNWEKGEQPLAEIKKVFDAAWKTWGVIALAWDEQHGGEDK